MSVSGGEDFVEAIVDYTIPTGSGVVFRRSAKETEHGISIPTSVHIRNARNYAPTLEKEGFTLTPHVYMPFELDENEIRTSYYPQVELLLKELTGASYAFAFEHHIRGLELPSQSTGAPLRPVHHVHSDLIAENALKSATRVLRMQGAPSNLLSGRFAAVNAWRPLAAVLRDPLAVCDARSVDPLDAIPTKLPNEKDFPTINSFRYNSSHRWWYFPHMTPEETLFFKHFDSTTAQMVPHTSFIDPSSLPDAPVRQSIEVRILLVF